MDQFDENDDETITWEEVVKTMEYMFKMEAEHAAEMGQPGLSAKDKADIMAWIRAEFMAADVDQSGGVDRG